MLARELELSAADPRAPRTNQRDLITGKKFWVSADKGPDREDRDEVFDYDMVWTSEEGDPTGKNRRGRSEKQQAEEHGPDLSWHMYYQYGPEDGDFEDPISPWHQIPIFPGRHVLNDLDYPAVDYAYPYTFVCTNPRQRRFRTEINLTVKFNPMMRYVYNGSFAMYESGSRDDDDNSTHMVGVYDNFGFIPQTLAKFGSMRPSPSKPIIDMRPMTAVDLGNHSCRIGEVYAVRPIAVILLFDGDEQEFFQIGVKITDRVGEDWLTWADVPENQRERLFRAMRWHRKGKGSGEILDLAHSIKILDNAHTTWHEMTGFWENPMSRIHPEERVPGGVRTFNPTIERRPDQEFFQAKEEDEGM
eukprot:gnl/TRDRNA2_/TRDRNA2_44142_c0_seq1.p1 gnl/TRDRNA2_/TRDRNA2_44142_c0~~gnl/TRDRNA2_/TRDRNA2_44142_c0_seq1.p1  ORF type:complete len:394 (+),score=58.33 gnl/TRDRNA2_/TRDRNA2_44142_c0_seq1:106-1182(+)